MTPLRTGNGKMESGVSSVFGKAIAYGKKIQ
jgi:hypothetical protein